MNQPSFRPCTKYVVCKGQNQHIILVCVLPDPLVLLLGLGHQKSFLIPKVKNYKGTLNLHKLKNTACIETLLFTVIKGSM